MFPSPTGVTYYELINDEDLLEIQTGIMFPSPTGVTYYEYDNGYIHKQQLYYCFRPQQGLLIMNNNYIIHVVLMGIGFRPQQGLLIMNCQNRFL